MMRKLITKCIIYDKTTTKTTLHDDNDNDNDDQFQEQ